MSREKEEAKENVPVTETVTEAETAGELETVEETEPEETKKPEETTEAEGETEPEKKTEKTEKMEETASVGDAEESDKEKTPVSLYEQEPFIDPSVYRQRRKKKTARVVFISILAGLLLVYIGGVIFHMNYFGLNVTVNGKNVSGKSVHTVEELLYKEARDYKLDIKFKDSDYTFVLGDADSEVAFTESVNALLHRHTPFLWFVNSFRSYDYKVGYTVSCDREKLKTFLDAAPAMNPASMVDSKDAKVVLEDGEAKIIPEQTGTRLDTDKLYNKVLNALKKYETEFDVEQEECYIPAHILSDSESIIKTKADADAFVAIDAVYDFGTYTYSIPKEELTRMAFVSSDGSVQISRNNVAAYVDKLKEQFTTAGTDREFTTHDKKTILVHGGYYGWVIDAETETEELYELLSKKKSFTKEPACERRGYAMCEQNDIGSTYVEIDLSKQHVYYYENGRMKWDSDCVSGQTPGHKTPGGLYGLDYKKMHATLIGEDYETPVTYWMPFNGGIGLHDASWRSKFGDDIYTYSGSHGCVNLPPDKAGELFEYVEAGMPIVCYWRDEVTFVKK